MEHTASTLLLTEDINKTLSSLRSVRSQIKALEQLEHSLKHDLSKSMNDAEYLYDKEGTVVATYKFVERVTLDTKDFRLNEPEIFEQYAKKSTTRTLLIKE